MRELIDSLNEYDSSQKQRIQLFQRFVTAFVFAFLKKKCSFVQFVFAFDLSVRIFSCLFEVNEFTPFRVPKYSEFVGFVAYVLLGFKDSHRILRFKNSQTITLQFSLCGSVKLHLCVKHRNQPQVSVKLPNNQPLILKVEFTYFNHSEELESELALAKFRSKSTRF